MPAATARSPSIAHGRYSAVPGARLVALFEPVRDDRGAALDRVVALVPRVVAVAGVVAEEPADRVLVVRSPGLDVGVEPLLKVGVIHGRPTPMRSDAVH